MATMERERKSERSYFYLRGGKMVIHWRLFPMISHESGCNKSRKRKKIQISVQFRVFSSFPPSVT